MSKGANVTKRHDVSRVSNGHEEDKEGDEETRNTNGLRGRYQGGESSREGTPGKKLFDRTNATGKELLDFGASKHCSR